MTDTRHLMLGENWGKMKLNGPAKAEIRKAEFLAVSKACEVIF